LANILVPVEKTGPKIFVHKIGQKLAKMPVSALFGQKVVQTAQNFFLLKAPERKICPFWHPTFWTLSIFYPLFMRSVKFDIKNLIKNYENNHQEK
jgi:hypothetical protein